MVHEDAGAIREVLQRVYAHRGTPVYAAEDEPLVCDDRADELVVAREHGEDVWNQVGYFVVA